MTQKIQILTLTALAAAAITAERFVTSTGQVATAAGNSSGVAESNAAAGERFPYISLGTAIVTAGGAIAKGARVEVGAAGKAVTLAAGKAVGEALEAAAADGDRIEVRLIPN